jgi:hypothetical protein
MGAQTKAEPAGDNEVANVARVATDREDALEIQIPKSFLHSYWSELDLFPVTFTEMYEYSVSACAGAQASRQLDLHQLTRAIMCESRSLLSCCLITHAADPRNSQERALRQNSWRTCKGWVEPSENAGKQPPLRLVLITQSLRSSGDGKAPSLS